jgi:hypothetical protein
VSCVIKSNPPPTSYPHILCPRTREDAFYYQISTVYALLITCSISLFQESITRFHATFAIFIASSPVSFYFLVYSIRAFWDEHRLNTVLGKKKYLNRCLVFLAVGIWISIVVYTSLSILREGTLWGFFWNPWLIPALLAAFSWIISIVLARKEIWPPGERYRPKFFTVW